jgi:DNA-binding CsgD family transcriptional regulator
LARAAKLPPEARYVLELASLVPGRTELGLLQAEDAAVEAVEALEVATRGGIVRIEGGAVVFRHELARRAIEDSLSDLRRMAMHRAILARLIERDEPSQARLAHHAAGARDAAAILRFAPLAAAEAAKAGAHSEAASHLRTALQYAGSAGEAVIASAAKQSPAKLTDRFATLAITAGGRAALLEALAYECYLTEQPEEALAHRVEATSIRHALGDTRLESENLRWQSRLTWRLGRTAEAQWKAKEAIAILQNEPCRELARAYSNQSQLHMLSQQTDAAIEWGERAIDLATTLGDEEVVAHALNSVGSASAMTYDLSGFEKIERALQLSLEHGFQEHAARSYGNLSALTVWLRQYSRAERFVTEGIAYCEERDILSWQLYITAWRARLHLERGQWDAAAADARSVLAAEGISAMNRILALAVLGTVKTRRGDPGAQELLDEARDLVLQVPELLRIAVVALARAEAAWLRGDLPSAVEELRDAVALADRVGATPERHDLDLWLWRAGGRDAPPAGRVATGDPSDEALALSDRGDVESLQSAVTILEQLGDGCLIHILRQRLRSLGVRGPRTPAHPAGLTPRELQILELLDEGLRNADIATRLHLSPKTVDHHVSSVLSKLGVKSRGEAARVFREGR